MKQMTIKRQMEAMKILQSTRGYDLDFRMDIKHNKILIVTNIVRIDTYDFERLYKAQFAFNIYTNIGTFDTDGYGFNIHIIDIS
jgi:hypothetical protein